MLASVEPHEFLSKDEFEALSDDEALAYVQRFHPALDAALKSGDVDRVLPFSEHLADLVEWTQSPEDYTRMVALPFWNAQWENIDKFVETLEELSASPELDESDRRFAAESLERARAIQEHKRGLEDL
jgi:hypothetical protein